MKQINRKRIGKIKLRNMLFIALNATKTNNCRVPEHVRFTLTRSLNKLILK